MPQQVYADTEAYETRWDDGLEAVVHTWKRYVDGDLFREGTEAMIELTERQNGSNILIDHRDMRLVDQEDQEHIVQEWIPRAIEAGATYHVVVHQESTIAEMNLGEVISLEDPTTSPR